MTGRVVPPNDVPALREALVALRDNPAETERMGRAGRERAATQFTWQAVVDRCLDAYAEPVAEAGAAAVRSIE